RLMLLRPRHETSAVDYVFIEIDAGHRGESAGVAIEPSPGLLKRRALLFEPVVGCLRIHSRRVHGALHVGQTLPRALGYINGFHHLSIGVGVIGYHSSPAIP